MQMTPTLLSSSLAYQNWQAATHSSFLLLSGRTVPEGRSGRGYTHSWLSPATVNVVEEMRERGGLVAYYCCHPDLRAEIHEGRNIIEGIVYQMLERKPEALRRKGQQFRAMVRNEAWRTQDESAGVKLTFQLLREVLLELKEPGTIFIVVDRIDLGSWKLHRVVAALVGLVLDEELGNVKIMATAAEYWDVESLEEKVPDSHVMADQGWDQRLLGRMEIQ